MNEQRSISNRMPRVEVEYDCRGKRKTREFGDDVFAARRFWIAKDRAGKNPKVKKETE